MAKLTALLDQTPVATLVHLVVTIVLGVDLLINGGLSDDALTYAAITEGGNGALSIGRGLSKKPPRA